MSEKRYMCQVCNGEGTWYMSRNAHESGGWVPCNACVSKGYLTEAEETARIKRKNEASYNLLKNDRFQLVKGKKNWKSVK